MTAMAIVLAFLSGFLSMNALTLWEERIRDWRPAARWALVGFVLACVAGWLA
jgi:hypothetical protein